MELTTISKVSKSLGISTRTLRYYEQIGLIKSDKLDDYAYRVYSPETVTRLNQILILRKLRIPLKQIADILKSDDAKIALSVFQSSIDEIDEEVTALSTIKSILNTFVEKINQSLNTSIKLDVLSDDTLTEIIDTLEITKVKLKEEKNAEDLQVANEKLNKLTDRDVRIVYLPPATVAAAYAKGEEPGPELVTAEIVDKFIKDTNLEKIYPAARHFGFNNPDEPVHGEGHGYERYITIPDDMEIPAPLVKKQFCGGVYAGVTISMGDWEAWGKLHEWVYNSEKYEFRWYTIEGVNGVEYDDKKWTCGWIEEHLNYWSWNPLGLSAQENMSVKENYETKQIELLIPIKPKEKSNVN